MGFIPSSTTLSATAYLTELGRQYLFDTQQTPRRITLPNGQTIDRLKISNFSLGDPDVDYDLPLRLEAGDIPDLSGENETSVKGAKGRMLSNIISPDDSDLPNDDIELVEYKSSENIITWNMANRLSVLKPVVTQQLMTFVDGDLVGDGLYVVTPTNYGKNMLKDNELVIMLKEPSLTQDGYRLRIIYPTTGSNYNKMTFQFEKASAQKATITQSVTTTITATPAAETVVTAPTVVTSVAPPSSAETA